MPENMSTDGGGRPQVLAVGNLSGFIGWSYSTTQAGEVRRRTEMTQITAAAWLKTEEKRANDVGGAALQDSGWAAGVRGYRRTDARLLAFGRRCCYCGQTAGCGRAAATVGEKEEEATLLWFVNDNCIWAILQEKMGQHKNNTHIWC
ncbi:UNVERIFIED_CONTAM: hypothetical protein Slati_2374500 [Sesamum latifolium]|uniref:Uncharacterized protein n=1 Tax=Sesamum latifolium TaxID=2727402 RepID=A0AAW2WFI4_9LAMI